MIGQHLRMLLNIIENGSYNHSQLDLRIILNNPIPTGGHGRLRMIRNRTKREHSFSDHCVTLLQHYSKIFRTLSEYC
jgi:hypothetical protein